MNLFHLSRHHPKPLPPSSRQRAFGAKSFDFQSALALHPRRGTRFGWNTMALSNLRYHYRVPRCWPPHYGGCRTAGISEHDMRTSPLGFEAILEKCIV
jgi:hypothetical protein